MIILNEKIDGNKRILITEEGINVGIYWQFRWAKDKEWLTYKAEKIGKDIYELIKKTAEEVKT